MDSFKLIFLILAFILSSFVSTNHALTCPDESEVHGCFCYDNSIHCSGSWLQNKSLGDELEDIRSLNNIGIDQWLNLSTFHLLMSNLTVLDLRPFLHLQMESFHLEENFNLSQIQVQISGKTGDEVKESDLVIRCKELMIVASPRLFFTTREHHDDDEDERAPSIKFALQFFSPKSLRTFSLASNKMNKFDESLQKFILRAEQENKNGTGIDLYLNNNEMATIPIGDFKAILDANPGNKIHFEGNEKLMCDEKVWWLKQGGKRYEKQLSGAICSNDKGHSIFNSTKVYSSGGLSMFVVPLSTLILYILTISTII